jgi:hypothetical protein
MRRTILNPLYGSARASVPVILDAERRTPTAHGEPQDDGAGPRSTLDIRQGFPANLVEGISHIGRQSTVWNRHNQVGVDASPLLEVSH